MKKALLLCALAMFIIIFARCESSDKKFAKLAKENGCLTEIEFLKLWHTSNYEEKLPCMILLEKISVQDISNRLERYATDSVEWIGIPSCRNNVMWIKSVYPYYYIGLTPQQRDWIQSQNIQYYINKPAIIKVYQVENGEFGPSKHFMTDLERIVE